MRAMILAGGMSTRLYPLTHEVPKPLVPIAGEPVVAHTMRYLRSFGIEDVAINVHYHGEMVHERLGDGSEFGVRLHYLEESKLMGSAGAVKQMEGFFDDTFIVIGCDELTDANLDSLVAFHRKRKALATIGLVEMDDVEQYGVVILNDDGRITAFQEKPRAGNGTLASRQHGHLRLRAGNSAAHPGRPILRLRQGAVPEAAVRGRRLLRSRAARGVLVRYRHAGGVPPWNQRRARGSRAAAGRPGPRHPARRDSGRRRADRGRRAHRRGRAPRGPARGSSARR